MVDFLNMDELLNEYTAKLNIIKSTSDWDVVVPRNIDAIVGYKKELKEIFRVLKNAYTRLLSSNNKFSIESLEDWRILYSRIPVLIRRVISSCVPNNDELYNGPTMNYNTEVFKFYKLVLILFELSMIGRLDDAKTLAEKIENTNYVVALRNSVINEPESSITNWLSSPKYVYRLVEKYAESISETKFMLVSFAYGGLRAGMLAKLYLEKKGFSIIHIPVRFSLKKWNDTKFKFLFNDDYDKFMDYLLHSKRLVFIDEDVSTSQTLKAARNYIRNLLIENITEDSVSKKTEKIDSLMENVLFTSINQVKGKWLGDNPLTVSLSALNLYPIHGKLNPNKIREIRKGKDFIKTLEKAAINDWFLTEPLSVLSKSEVNVRLSNEELILVQSNNESLFEFLTEKNLDVADAEKTVLLLFNIIKEDSVLFGSWKSKLFSKKDIKSLLDNLRDNATKPIHQVLAKLSD